MIAVLDYGIGNLRSAEKALQYLGADASLVDDPDRAAAADAVVLPGVGSFGRCAQALRSSGLDKAATAAIERGVPFLGICVGFQLLYEGSEESPSEQGLGVLPGTVRRLAEGVKRPQMQWNVLDSAGPSRRWPARGRAHAGLGLLRALVCTGAHRAHLVHLRLRRTGDRVGRAGHGVGNPVPPRKVRLGRPRHPGQLRPRRDRRAAVMDLYPAIDIRDGGAVRLAQGDFGRQSDYGDPLELAHRFAAVRRTVAPRGRPRCRPGRGSGQPPDGAGHRRRRRCPGPVRRRGAHRGRCPGAAVGRGEPGRPRDAGPRRPRPGPHAWRRPSPAGWASGSTTASTPTVAPRLPSGGGSRAAGGPWTSSSATSRAPDVAAVIVTAIERDGMLSRP